jgi:Holliday junction DNA helicase RuvA
MITFITGKVFKNSLEENAFVDIETKGGVGYRVFVHKRFDFKEKGDEIFLFTSHQVREDSQTLYGFETEEERGIFEKLIDVSGIGPKIGIAIISEYSEEDLKKIISKGDITALSKVSGLGKKGAQKIVLELSGKLNMNEDISIGSEILVDVKNALESLGYNGSALKESMEKAADIAKEESLVLEEVLKLVLRG